MVMSAHTNPSGNRNAGLTLIELLVALALSTLLLLGLVQIATAASSSTQLQRNQARIQEHARMASKVLSAAVRQAGFNPQPWSAEFPAAGLAELSVDGVSRAGDRLAVRYWSDLNCFENRNPDVDEAGNPLFYIRESVFDMNTTQSLTHQCRYGPSISELTTQIRRQGFINEVESFQVLYGVDPGGEAGIEAWVKAGQWTDPAAVVGVRIGLLLVSTDAVVTPTAQRFDVLDATINRGADGKLRRVIDFSVAIKGKSG